MCPKLLPQAERAHDEAKDTYSVGDSALIHHVTAPYTPLRPSPTRTQAPDTRVPPSFSPGSTSRINAPRKEDKTRDKAREKGTKKRHREKISNEAR